MTDFRALCAELVVIEDAMSGGSVQLSSQGQALDGYAGLAAFCYIAAKARIALTQPEPQGPTDEELANTYWKAWHEHLDRTNSVLHAVGLRAVLARWGRPAIEPVPVSERLPGPADCDAEGLCWWWEPDCEQPEAWCIGLPEYCGSSTHWLPHWALPVPQEEARK